MSSLTSPLASRYVDVQECRLLSPVLARPTNGLTNHQKFIMENIGQVTTSISVYESLFSPTLSGTLRVADDANLSTLFPFLGLESLLLRFRIFSPDTMTWRYYGSGSPVELRVYSQSKRTPVRMSLETYELNMASPELISLTEKQISKAFVDKTVEQVVSSVMQEYVSTNKKYGTDIAPDGLPYFEPTTGSSRPFRFVVPYLTPYDAIRLACIQAATEDDRSNFFFFETLDGFYFRSLQQLIRQGKERWQRNPIYIRRQFGGTSPTRDSARYLSASEMELVQSFDMLYAVSQGYFASTTVGVDVLSGKYRTTMTSVGDRDFRNRQRLNQV